MIKQVVVFFNPSQRVLTLGYLQEKRKEFYLFS